jgi:hypothetical protein
METAATVLARPNVELDALLRNAALEPLLPPALRELCLDSDIAATVTTDCKYRRYVERQAREIATLVREEAITLPTSMWPCAGTAWYGPTHFTHLQDYHAPVCRTGAVATRLAVT